MRRTVLFSLLAFFLLTNAFGYAAHAIGMEMSMEAEQEKEITIVEDAPSGGCEGNQCCNSQTDCLYQYELQEDSAFSFQPNTPSDIPIQNSGLSLPERNLTKKITAPQILHAITAEFLTEKQLK